MRISTKLTLGSSLVGLVVFGGIGAVQVAREKRDLEEAVLRDTSVLCLAVRESIRQDIEQADPADSEALTRVLEGLDPRLDVVLWRGRKPAPLGRQEVHSPVELVERLAVGASVAMPDVVTEIAALGSDRRILGVAAAVTPGGRDAVVLTRPLDDVDADIAEEAELIAIAVVGFSLLSGLLGYLLGRIYVERPLSSLDRAMARIARGDLEASLGPGREDEVGRVTRRFDEMAHELQLARDRLENEQAAHRTALARLRDADRLVTVGQLSAGLAHEIGSPLQILQSRARKLQLHVDDPVEVARGATIIVAQLERITRVVEQLLEFARPHRPTRRTTDPEASVRAVVDLLELEAKHKSIEIVVHGEPMPTAELDADAIQQIVLNLARNAIAAARTGDTIWVDVSHVPAPGGDGGAPSPANRGHLRLRVVDNGPGIAEDVVRRMFEPFFTTRGSDGGTGLGLAVVKSLVDALGGTIEVDASTERGTQFEVTLPC